MRQSCRVAQKYCSPTNLVDVLWRASASCARGLMDRSMSTGGRGRKRRGIATGRRHAADQPRLAAGGGVRDGVVGPRRAQWVRRSQLLVESTPTSSCAACISAPCSSTCGVAPTCGDNVCRSVAATWLRAAATRSSESAAAAMPTLVAAAVHERVWYRAL